MDTSSVANAFICAAVMGMCLLALKRTRAGLMPRYLASYDTARKLVLVIMGRNSLVTLESSGSLITRAYLTPSNGFIPLLPTPDAEMTPVRSARVASVPIGQIMAMPFEDQRLGKTTTVSGGILFSDKTADREAFRLLPWAKHFVVEIDDDALKLDTDSGPHSVRAAVSIVFRLVRPILAETTSNQSAFDLSETLDQKLHAAIVAALKSATKKMTAAKANRSCAELAQTVSASLTDDESYAAALSRAGAELHVIAVVLDADVRSERAIRERAAKEVTRLRNQAEEINVLIGGVEFDFKQPFEKSLDKLRQEMDGFFDLETSENNTRSFLYYDLRQIARDKGMALKLAVDEVQATALADQFWNACAERLHERATLVSDAATKLADNIKSIKNRVKGLRNGPI